MEPPSENVVSGSALCLEVKPLKTIEELFLWQSTEELVSSLASVPHLQPMLPKTRNKTLVCHDMKGGYLEDRFVTGCLSAEGYRFFHWSGIDYFVYFSHYFITIPPLGWTAAAHKNGVPMLGTLITEGDEGGAICKELFSSLENVEVAVQQLVNIAIFFKFEGWLINIENEIDTPSIGLVVVFLQRLTQAMRTRCPHSCVIWYDSITSQGALRWQNELNDNNSCFYGACDGIFLNYSWKEQQLSNSAAYARKFGAALANGVTCLTGLSKGGEAALPRKAVAGLATRLGRAQEEEGAETKVFVGVDVFGRKFYEGGGLNTYKAMEVIRSHNLSAAIFAPGWTMEVLGPDDFYAQDCRMWRPMMPFLHQHGPLSWPVTTTFCDGCAPTGRKGKDGQCSTWYNLLCQDLMPQLWQSETGTGIDLSSEFHPSRNTSLLLSNCDESTEELRLWSNCALPIDCGQRITVSMSLKGIADEGEPTKHTLTGVRLSSSAGGGWRLQIVLSDGRAVLETASDGYPVRSASHSSAVAGTIEAIGFVVPPRSQFSVSNLRIIRE